MPSTTNRRVGRLAAIVTTVLMGVAAAVAFPIILLGFESQYPATTIPDYTDDATGDQCLTCHSSANRSEAGNAYRIALKDAFLDYVAIDLDDSDGDGVPNGEEAETPRVDPPLMVSGTAQVGYNPGLIDCPNGLLGYDPLTRKVVTGVHETPPSGTVWMNEMPGVNCDDGLDNDCDSRADALDSDCAVECVVDSDCNDGVFCNGVESCNEFGQCVDGTPPSCDDASDCTADSCDAGSDTCQNVPVANGTSCSDGTFCNGIEVCQFGTCSAGTPPTCNDGDACTVDACDPDLDGCTNVAPPVPGEGALTGLQIVAPGLQDVQISWQSSVDATGYNLYVDTAGDLSGLSCSQSDLPGTSAFDGTAVAAGQVALFLVTNRNCSGESTLGAGTGGAPRVAAVVCP